MLPWEWLNYHTNQIPKFSAVFHGVKMRALVERKLEPVNWNEDVWVNPNEAGDIEPLNFAKTSLSVKAALIHLTEEVNPALSVMTFPEVIVLKNTADSLLNHTHHPSFLIHL